MKLIQLNGNGPQILSGIWLTLGILLPILYLTPLFGSALYELNGIDVISAMDDLSSDKLRTFDQTSGALMVVLPQIAVFLGFLGIGLGIHGLATKKIVLTIPYMVASLLVLLAGIFCAIRLENESTGFFAMVKPTPESGFYLILVVLGLIIMAPIVLSVLLSRQGHH